MYARRNSSTVLGILAAFTCAGAVLAEGQGAQVDKLFEPWTKPGSPGAAVAVFHNGEIVHQAGYGLANLEHGAPITSQTVFYLGSVGKQFTAMAIALLEKEGKLSVDDDIREYVPEMPEYGAPITIRHLLHHTSGIRDYLELMEIAGLELGHFRSDAEVVALLARQKNLNFLPGEDNLYSNSGYFLLGVIAHRASGKTLKEYAAEKIFGPLGMKSSHVHDDYTHIIKRRASAYLTGEDGELANFITTFDRVGSGGVFSTVEDLFLWEENFYHHEVGGAGVVEQLHTRGVLNDGEELDYAFGLAIGEHRGLELVGHGGALGGYRSYLGRFPEQRFSVVILSNLDTMRTRALGLQIAEIYLAEHFASSESEPAAAPREPEQAIEVSAEKLASWAGLYFAPTDLLVRRIKVDDGRLIYSRTADSENELLPLSEDRFLMKLDAPIRVEAAFRPGPSDSAPEMLVTVNDEDPSVFQRVEPVSYTAPELAAFAGTFYSGELDDKGHLVVDGGTLKFRDIRSADFPIVARFADFFMDDSGSVSVSFGRDEQGRVTGFALNTGRVRGLGFTRVPDRTSPLDAWWDHLTALCGNAYAGTLTSEDATDAALAEESMTMHVRRCEQRRLEVPFHIGANRSRTWVLTRTDDGLRLRHDHRHEDGSEDAITLYGGHTDDPGTERAQHFPADEYSKQLFEATGLSASVANVWTMEIVPGERFSYILRRPGRHFQADFDLSRPVDPPPAPWGHE